MKSKFLQFTLGVLTGAVLFGGTVAIAAGITAQPAWSPIYVDGQQVQMTAYNILGNNFVKLRDIGQAVGFNVYYQDGVQVDSNAPYTGEAPAQATTAEPIRVSSYKGSTLKAGDRSGLMIGPSGKTYTVTSSNPAVVDIENVSGNWVAVTKVPGSAVITASDGAGGTGSLTLTVEGPVKNGETTTSSGVDLSANMDIRLEMVRLINQVRRENGRAELPIEESLMNAAQDVSSQCVMEHRPYDHIALSRYGWPHGGLYNLTVFTAYGCPDVARQATTYWVESPGHYETMLSEGSHIGTGVTFKNGRAYCYMVVGDPDSCNPYT
jgi:uncharacterized protein YkwD